MFPKNVTWSINHLVLSNMEAIVESKVTTAIGLYEGREYRVRVEITKACWDVYLEDLENHSRRVLCISQEEFDEFFRVLRRIA